MSFKESTTPVKFRAAVIVAAAIVCTLVALPSQSPASTFHAGNSNVDGGTPGTGDGDSCDTATTGPINIYNGAKLLRVLDVEVPGPMPIRLERRYNSQKSFDSPVGYGWAFTYNMRVFEHPDESVTFRRDCGVRYRYVKNGPSFNIDSDLPSPGELVEGNGTSTSYLLTRPGGMVYEFDMKGRLARIRNPAGNALVFGYEPNAGSGFGGKHPLSGRSANARWDSLNTITTALVHQLTRIEQEIGGQLTGRAVDLKYHANGRLDEVETFDRRILKYTHDTSGNLTSVDGPYFYSASPPTPAGIVKTYRYDVQSATEKHLMHALTYYQDGQGLLGRCIVYDGEGRGVYEGYLDESEPYSSCNKTDPSRFRGYWELEYAYGGDANTTLVREMVYDTEIAQGQTEPALLHQAEEIYEFDEYSYLKTYIDAEQNELRITRNANHQPTIEERYESAQLVQRVTFDYSVQDRVVKTVDPLGGWNWDGGSGGQPPSESWLVRETTQYASDWTNWDGKVLWRKHESSETGSNVFCTVFGYTGDRLDEIHRGKGESGSGNCVDVSGDPVAGLEPTIFGYGAANNLVETITVGVAPDVHVLNVQHYSGGQLGSTTGTKLGLLERVFQWVDHTANPLVESEIHRQEFDYDKSGNVALIRDARDLVGAGSGTQYLYDAKRRVTTVTLDGGDQIILDYEGPIGGSFGDFLVRSEVGYRESGTGSGNGVITLFNVNDRGDLISVERTSGGIPETWWTYAYDTQGNRIRATDAESVLTSIAYDATGFLASIDHPRSTGDTLVTSNMLGQTVSMTDPEGLLVEIARDPLGRIAGVGRTPNGGLASWTRFGLDAHGNVLNVTDQRLNQTKYTYDGRSRLKTVEQPLNEVTTYDYDGRGRLRVVTDQRSGAGEWNKIEYLYDYDDSVPKEERHYLVGATVADRTIELSRNPLEKIESVIDDEFDPVNPMLEFGYDDLNRLDSETAKYIPDTPVLLDRKVEYTYHRFGTRHEIKLFRDVNLQFTSTYTPDDFGRLDEIAAPGGNIIDLTYFNDDRVDKMIRSGGASVTTSHMYEADNLVKELRVDETDPVTVLVDDLDFAYTEAGLVDTITSSWDGLHDYDYTGLQQLDVASHDALAGYPTFPGVEDFGYDDSENLVTKDVDGNNEVNVPTDDNNRIDATGYSYDAAGNPTAYPGSISLGWNARNELVEYSDGVVTTYAYDAFGRRYKKTTGGTSTYFLWAGDDLIAEYDETAQRTVHYTYGTGFAPVQVAIYNGASDDYYQVHTDHLETPRLLTDPDGTVVWRARQHGFGSAELDAGNSVSFNIRFPGQYFDGESGLHYNRFRYYDPGLGRFLNRDPIGQLGGVNTYAYALNDPVGSFDPNGLAAFKGITSEPVYVHKNDADPFPSSPHGHVGHPKSTTKLDANTGEFYKNGQKTGKKLSKKKLAKFRQMLQARGLLGGLVALLAVAGADEAAAHVSPADDSAAALALALNIPAALATSAALAWADALMAPVSPASQSGEEATASCGRPPGPAGGDELAGQFTGTFGALNRN